MPKPANGFDGLFDAAHKAVVALLTTLHPYIGNIEGAADPRRNHWRCPEELWPECEPTRRARLQAERAERDRRERELAQRQHPTTAMVLTTSDMEIQTWYAVVLSHCELVERLPGTIAEVGRAMTLLRDPLSKKLQAARRLAADEGSPLPSFHSAALLETVQWLSYHFGSGATPRVRFMIDKTDNNQALLKGAATRIGEWADAMRTLRAALTGLSPDPAADDGYRPAAWFSEDGRKVPTARLRQQAKEMKVRTVGEGRSKRYCVEDARRLWERDFPPRKPG